jgi:hypothetical protein
VQSSVVSNSSTAARSRPDAVTCASQRPPRVADRGRSLRAGRGGQVGKLAGDPQHRRLRVIAVQPQLGGDRPRPAARGPAPVPHSGAGGAARGLHPSDRLGDLPDRLGEQARVGGVGDVGSTTVVSARTFSVRSSLPVAALASSVSFSASTAVGPQRVVIFISVVGWGTRVPSGMRVNRCQLIESATSRHSDS